MIRLTGLTKHYPGQAEPAVDHLDLEVPEGEIVVFVGPSGCGKTTTMKLVNRLIEPTSGRIEIDGRDVTGVDPDRLRRGIGYAIQQTGLFPHRTVADNIATVPRLLGWGRERIAARVDELLAKVGLDPQTYRDRHPGRLSGGQQQRVGVARALAADPPVLLMDEPFGAIDPLTREALQEEFLRLQRDIRKTIVFVTHDIDEAVKMGDRIAIFGECGRVLQYDTPARILGEPAEGFVADFIGNGTNVRRLSLTRLCEVEVSDDRPVVVRGSGDGGCPTAPGSFALLVDRDRRPLGWAEPGQDRPLPLISHLGPEHTLHDALDAMLANNSDTVVVTDQDGRYRGTVEMATIQTHLHRVGGPGNEGGPVRGGERADRSIGTS
ncbi:ATP-binding cassette domain-containing protein [Nocardiopsis sp. HNM0947]|uniref:ATP-binding cassette domain-containing protein n=2 Tax=Nocardiopsis coralli TaxID=2772213 RepID=A0ABR9P152_9ACTN|nr:ATP-binding cassette domain-containing protein [Nocardiopsis coralli]